MICRLALILTTLNRINKFLKNLQESQILVRMSLSLKTQCNNIFINIKAHIKQLKYLISKIIKVKKNQVISKIKKTIFKIK